MATERNPFDQIPQDNVVELNVEKEMTGEANIEIDPDTGEIIVDLQPISEELEIEIDLNAGFYENLAENLDDDRLEEIGNMVIDKFEADKDSRAEWESMFERGFDLLGLKLEDTTEPFEGAATAVHPLLIESAVKFQSKASQELFPSKGPVKTQVVGQETIERIEQANRVQNFMNYQLTEQMPEYFDEFERMLFHLPLIGSAIKKIYYDASLGRPVAGGRDACANSWLNSGAGAASVFLSAGIALSFDARMIILPSRLVVDRIRASGPSWSTIFSIAVAVSSACTVSVVIFYLLILCVLKS